MREIYPRTQRRKGTPAVRTATIPPGIEVLGSFAVGADRAADTVGSRKCIFGHCSNVGTPEPGYGFFVCSGCLDHAVELHIQIERECLEAMAASDRALGGGGMSDGTVEERVLEVIGGQLGMREEELAEIGRDEDLAEFGLDSLGQVELVMALEEEFDIEIAESVFDVERTNLRLCVSAVEGQIRKKEDVAKGERS